MNCPFCGNDLDHINYTERGVITWLRHGLMSKNHNDIAYYCPLCEQELDGLDLNHMEITDDND